MASYNDNLTRVEWPALTVAAEKQFNISLMSTTADDYPFGIFAGNFVGEPAATAEFTVYVTDPVAPTREMPPPPLTIEQLMATIMPVPPVDPKTPAPATEPMLISDSPSPEDSQNASLALGSAAEPIVIEESSPQLGAFLESFGSYISGSEAPEIEEHAALGHFEEAARAVNSAPERAVIIQNKDLSRNWPSSPMRK